MADDISRLARGGADKRARLRENLLLFVGMPLGWGVFILGFVWLATISEPFSMSSSSMLPTLRPGDHIIARENYYQSVKPARGDLVVHRLPGRRARELYVERVVGLPGDRIQIVQGVLHVNGAPVGRTPNGNHVLIDGAGPPRRVPQYVETLPGGRAHRIIETGGDTSHFDDTRTYTVPPDHYFVLGDNRDNSADSRIFGPVPAEFIRHRPLFIYWSRSSGRIGMRVR